MKPRTSRALAALLAIGALTGGLRGLPHRERDSRPRDVSDARMAAAEAKRQRKAAKRAREANSHGAGVSE